MHATASAASAFLACQSQLLYETAPFKIQWLKPRLLIHRSSSKQNITNSMSNVKTVCREIEEFSNPR